MKNFDEFVALWMTETSNKKTYKELKHLLFLVVYQIN